MNGIGKIPAKQKSLGIAILIKVFILISGGAYSQDNLNLNIKGSVIDSESQLPIPFCHLFVLPDSSGVFTDLNGNFDLSLKHSDVNRTIQLSCLGYKSHLLNLDSLSDGSIIQLEPTSYFSEQVIISSAKRPQRLSLSPARVEVLKSAILEQEAVKSFDELLEKANGLELTRSSGSNVQALSIRGSSEVAGGGIGNRVLLLIDGLPFLSPESGGALWNLVPVNAMERVEILKGPYSSLYGSSAVGGVVNAISKKPSKKFQSNLKIKSGIYGNAPANSEYDQNGSFQQMGLGLSNSMGNSSYLLDLNYLNNNGHREKSAYESFNAFGKYIYNSSLNNQWIFRGGINVINNDTPASWLSSRLAYSVAEHKKDDFQRKKEYHISTEFRNIVSDVFKYDSRSYYYGNSSEFDFNDDPANDSTNVNIGKQTVDLSSVKTHRIGHISQVDYYRGDHYLLGGIEIQYDYINGVPDTVLYGEHQSIGFASFIQDEWSLNPHLIITAGARLDYYSIINEYSEINFSPKVAAVYKPYEELSLRFLFGRAFRNPSIAERFIKFEQGGGLRFIPNPDLVSEKLTRSFELGALWNINSSLSLDLSLYHNRYADLISFQQVANPEGLFLFKVVNLKDAVIKGFEISSQYSIYRFLNARISYSFLDAKDISSDRFNDDLAYKIKHSFNYAFNLPFKKWNLNLNGKYRSGVEEVFIYPGDEPEAYWLHNFKISYKFKPKFRFSIGVNNFSNTLYEELERYRRPGRNYFIGLSYSSK